MKKYRYFLAGEAILFLFIILTMVIGNICSLVRITGLGSGYVIGEDLLDEKEVFVDTESEKFEEQDIILVYSRERLTISPSIYRSNIIIKVNHSYVVWEATIQMGKKLSQIVHAVF